MRNDPRVLQQLVDLAQQYRHNQTITPEEAMRQIGSLKHLHPALVAAGITFGITLDPTVFGDVRQREGRLVPNMRQTLVADTPHGTYHCVGDGGMTLAEHSIWLADYLRLKGVLR